MSKVDKLRLAGAAMPLVMIAGFAVTPITGRGTSLTDIILLVVVAAWVVGPSVVFWLLSREAGPLLGQHWLMWGAIGFIFPPAIWAVVYFWKADREETRVWQYNPSGCVACSRDLGSDYAVFPYYTAKLISTQTVGVSYLKLLYAHFQHHDLRVCPACAQKEKRRKRNVVILGVGAIPAFLLSFAVAGIANGVFGFSGERATLIMVCGVFLAVTMGGIAIALSKMALNDKLRQRARIIRGGESTAVFTPDEYKLLKPESILGS